MKKGKAPSKKSGADGSRKGETAPSTSRKPVTKAPAPSASPSKGKAPSKGTPPAKGSGGKTSGSASAGKTSGSAPVSKAPASKPAPKPSASKSGTKSAGKPAAKPAAAPTPVAKAGKAAKPVKPAASAKGAVSPKGAAPAKSAARPSLVAPIAVSPKVEAPKKFQREYKKWLERLILLRHALLRDGERLEEEGLKALEQEVSVDHMADFGSDSYEQDNTLALIESKSEALRDVDESIRKIEVGSYGLCEECEQLIPSGRLEVLPHARYCVNCQSKREGVVE